MPAGIATMVALALFVATVAAYHASGGDRYWATRLAAFDALPRDGGPLVVTVGDSLLQFGTLPPPAMAGLVAEAARPRPRWVSLNRDGLDSAEMAAILPEVLARRPSLLVFQVEPLDIDPGEKGPATWVPFVGSGNAAHWFRAWLRAGLTRRADVFAEELRFMDAYDCGAIPADRMAHWDEVLAAQSGRGRIEPYGGKPSSVAERILAAATSDARVLVVDVPTARPPNPAVEPLVRALFEVLRRRSNVDAVRCPLRVTAAETCDGKHYAEPARRRYAAWLAAEVAQSLGRAARR